MALHPVRHQESCCFTAPPLIQQCDAGQNNMALHPVRHQESCCFTAPPLVQQCDAGQNNMVLHPVGHQESCCFNAPPLIQQCDAGQNNIAQLYKVAVVVIDRCLSIKVSNLPNSSSLGKLLGFCVCRCRFSRSRYSAAAMILA